MSEQLEVIGVRFKPVGKIYYFDPKGHKLKADDGVIIETIRGVEYGIVALANRFVAIEEIVMPLKPLIRIGTESDKKQYLQNKEDAKEAMEICNQKVIEHDLYMKLIDCEYTFDKNKVLFYFTAEGRIDFRDLVKDLASIFRTRIELRQIGVRDEAKSLNGIGICGRTLCCATFLGDFQPVSIKMAKEQNLSLNPTKISGICGRLMCCLKYEEEAYDELNKKLPNVGDSVETKDGKGQILAVNTLRQIVKVGIKNTDESISDIIFYSVEEVKVTKSRGKKQVRIPTSEYNELKGLED